MCSAHDVSSLAGHAKQIHKLVEQMIAQGASVEQITHIITDLNDAITQRVIELVLEQSPVRYPFTWLSFGSEGRGEQTLKTDQDNGILFVPPKGVSTDQVREELLPMARRINEALDQCGFPLCPGNIMASNPDCCLSLEEWRARFSRWVDQGTPEHLLYATIYFDYRVLYGDEQPGIELRDWLTEKVRGNSRFRRQMAANAMRMRPPLGLLRDFVLTSGGEHPHSLDLKTNGVTPFVDAARIYAFACGIGESNTLARLRGAVHCKGGLREADVEAWAEAYNYIQLLRLRNHRRQQEEGKTLSNHVDPDTLNELDRRILKEAFRQARKLQSKVTLEYQL